MCYVQVVKILDCFGDFCNSTGNLFLSHSINAFFEVLEQCAFLHVLQDEVHIFIVRKESV